MNAPVAEHQPEFSRRPEPETRPGTRYSLWRDAPAWRNLFIGAVFFTALGLVIPAFDLGSAVTRAGCNLKPGPLSIGGTGKVVGFVPHEQALAVLHGTEERLHAKVSPNYLHNVRVVVEPYHYSIGVPDSITVNIGDRVDWNGRYTDETMPCNWVPPLISRVINTGTVDGGPGNQ
jgi:hypothetical protein